MNYPRRSLVGVFRNAQDAEFAVNELKESGLPMEQVSVMAKDPQADPGRVDHDRAPDSKAQVGTNAGVLAGGAVGGTIGLVVGLGTIVAVPGMGPLMLLGAAVTALATALGGGVLGATAGGVLGALIGLGIPEERAAVYHDRIQDGGYVVIVDGTEAEIRAAEGILNRWRAEDLHVYTTTQNAPIAHPRL